MMSHLIAFSSEIFLLSYRYTSYHTLCFQNLFRTIQLSVKYVNWIVTKNSTDGTIIKVTKKTVFSNKTVFLLLFFFICSPPLLFDFLFQHLSIHWTILQSPAYTLPFHKFLGVPLKLIPHFLRHYHFCDFFPIAPKTIGSNCS